MNLKAYQVAEIVNGEVEGNDQVSIDKLSKIESGEEGSLSFLGNSKYNNFLYSSKSSIIIINKSFDLDQPINKTLIRVEDPNKAFSILLKSFNKNKRVLSGIDKNSSISSSVKYEQDLYMGSYSVCQENSVLGKNVKIHSQVFIGENVSIGNNTIIFPGVKIYDNCIIGNDCIVHANTVIGSDGFGFNLDKNGNQIKVIHNGNVILEDSVELGANCTIDKATLGSTIIKKGVKIDNLVQVAHNVVIGENTVIAGLVGIAGSTIIGKNCMIGGQAGISGHLNIGDRVMIQAASAVFKNIKSDSAIMGYPAISYRDYSKSYIHFKNLPSVMKSLDKIFKSEKDG
jgi:UDP-3-O-[3-hydroxymyristoyl] glucosamine N-acyltransferase